MYTYIDEVVLMRFQTVRRVKRAVDWYSKCESPRKGAVFVCRHNTQVSHVATPNRIRTQKCMRISETRELLWE